MERILQETTEEGASSGTHPAIVKDAGGEKDHILIVEKQEVVAGSPDDILMMWGASFWIFNLKTSKHHANMNWFLRSKVYGGLKADVPPSAAAVDMVKQME